MTFNLVYIDDEEMLCNVFSEFFSSETVHVRTFTDHEAAVAFDANAQVQLYVIDYRLNATTGDIVAAQLNSETPKVLVSGELEVPAINGFDHIIYKPYKLSELKSLFLEYASEFSD
jgi:DNA-binding NtrC family response regulator